MRITIIGCGRWGSFHAWYSNHIGHEVTLYGRETSARMNQLIESRRNDYLILPDTVKLTNNLQEAVVFGEVIVISIGSQQLRSFLRELNEIEGIDNKRFVLCMKGLESSTGNRLSTVLTDEINSALSIPNSELTLTFAEHFAIIYNI